MVHILVIVKIKGSKERRDFCTQGYLFGEWQEMSEGLTQDLDSKALTQQSMGMESPRAVDQVVLMVCLRNGKPASLWKITASWPFLLCKDTH